LIATFARQTKNDAGAGPFLEADRRPEAAIEPLDPTVERVRRFVDGESVDEPVELAATAAKMAAPNAGTCVEAATENSRPVTSA
jgi:hypothetical protein